MTYSTDDVLDAVTAVAGSDPRRLPYTGRARTLACHALDQLLGLTVGEIAEAVSETRHPAIGRQLRLKPPYEDMRQVLEKLDGITRARELEAEAYSYVTVNGERFIPGRRR